MEKQLIEKILSRDAKTFTAVYDKYCGKVYSVAFGVLKDEFDAEDVMQEVFIQLPKKLKGLKNPNAFEGWLLRITKNKAIDVLRKRKDVSFSELSFSDEDDFGEGIESQYLEFQPEESYNYEESKKIFLEIIEGIPDEQRECIRLRYANGMSLKEIAKETGTSLPTVKSRLKYGKEKIEKEAQSLEKKGIKLYGIATVMIIPFIRWVLLGGKKTSELIFSAAASTMNTVTVNGVFASVVAVALIGASVATVTIVDINKNEGQPVPMVSISPSNVIATPLITPQLVECYTPTASNVPTNTPTPTPTVKPKTYLENIENKDTEISYSAFLWAVDQHVSLNEKTWGAEPYPLRYDLSKGFDEFNVLGYDVLNKSGIDVYESEIRTSTESGEEKFNDFSFYFRIPYKNIDTVKEAILRDNERMRQFTQGELNKIKCGNTEYSSLTQLLAQPLEEKHIVLEYDKKCYLQLETKKADGENWFYVWFVLYA